MKSAADKLEKIVLSHPNPEEIWSVSKSLEALTERFHYKYAPSYIKYVLVLLSANGPYPGFRSIFHKVGKDAFRLLPKFIEKRKEEQATHAQCSRDSTVKCCFI